ncbi:hypothetical protein CVT24_003163 [Panaeolus cyanescens]|uniref:C2H2-type domain-containing protein n=1 Tax=Panaeolus cyanescens TaxID=181874 RepID=A0A409VNY4_9AGAR|nr:hypothetical protein CVT24_003163 [Panaeolus cyanescens]
MTSTQVSFISISDRIILIHIHSPYSQSQSHSQTYCLPPTLSKAPHPSSSSNPPPANIIPLPDSHSEPVSHSHSEHEAAHITILEQSICSNYICCNTQHYDLHALLQHTESTHIGPSARPISISISSITTPHTTPIPTPPEKHAQMAKPVLNPLRIPCSHSNSNSNSNTTSHSGSTNASANSNPALSSSSSSASASASSSIPSSTPSSSSTSHPPPSSLTTFRNNLRSSSKHPLPPRVYTPFTPNSNLSYSSTWDTTFAFPLSTATTASSSVSAHSSSSSSTTTAISPSDTPSPSLTSSTSSLNSPLQPPSAKPIKPNHPHSWYDTVDPGMGVDMGLGVAMDMGFEFPFSAGMGMGVGLGMGIGTDMGMDWDTLAYRDPTHPMIIDDAESSDEIEIDFGARMVVDDSVPPSTTPSLRGFDSEYDSDDDERQRDVGGGARGAYDDAHGHAPWSACSSVSPPPELSFSSSCCSSDAEGAAVEMRGVRGMPVKAKGKATTVKVKGTTKGTTKGKSKARGGIRDSLKAKAKVQGKAMMKRRMVSMGRVKVEMEMDVGDVVGGDMDAEEDGEGMRVDANANVDGLGVDGMSAGGSISGSASPGPSTLAAHSSALLMRTPSRMAKSQAGGGGRGVIKPVSAKRKREKMYKCPDARCTKTYLNPNGLKYHLEKGTCVFESSEVKVNEEEEVDVKREGDGEETTKDDHQCKAEADIPVQSSMRCDDEPTSVSVSVPLPESTPTPTISESCSTTSTSSSSSSLS